MDKLEHIVASALAEFEACNDPAALENCKAKFLGKSGQLTESLKALGKLSAADRQIVSAAPAAVPRAGPVGARAAAAGEERGENEMARGHNGAPLAGA